MGEPDGGGLEASKGSTSAGSRACFAAVKTARWLLVLFCVALAACAGPSYKGYRYKPYTVRGVYYVPMHPRATVGYVEEGLASFYNESGLFFPGRTALGEKIYPWTKCAAHKTLPLPCRIRVTNLRNGRSVVLRVSDRGPFVGNRILDVSVPVAKELGFYRAGLAPVRIKVLSVGDGSYRIKKRSW